MATDASIDLVQRFVELRAAGDWAGAVEHLDPKVRILVPSLMPYGGTWSDRMGALELLDAATHTWSSWRESPSPAPLAASGERVYREVVVDCTAAATGRSVATSTTEVFVVRGGHITEIRTYFADVATVTDALA